ncbi:restriction endonuclease subunit S [Jannaschia seosinensis]|uniref:restriction endonuclease subunit S n=1 Tax=Jannaschia seosinensis TaxID=313367 RepID=UPI0006E2C403|nr:restriction endonuclease subunit S [Jannaschia seosinensis]
MDFHEHSGKTGVPGVNRNDLHTVRIPTANDPKEQEAIAEALSDADALIEGLERLIAKKRLIKQGAMQDLLTGKRRLPGFSGEWKPMTLFEMADSNKKNFDDGDWIEAEHIAPTGMRLIQTGNVGIGRFIDSNRKYIFPESFNKLRCKEVHPGDVLICRLADPPGRACIVPDLGEE